MHLEIFQDMVDMVDSCSSLVTIPEIPEHYKFKGKFLEFEVVCAPLCPSGSKNRSPKFRYHGNRFSTPSLSTNQAAAESTAANPTMSMSTINVPCDKRHFGSPGGSTTNGNNNRPLTSLSQPCLPVCIQGPTKILPFLYLGSQQDVMDRETLKKYGIDFVLNLSTSCPKPDHLQDEHFLRIPVQDSYTEALLPYFEQTFQFLDMVREASGVALIHCLAGISRSPTLAIAYVMRYLHMNQEEAYRYVKEKRPSISPNFNFLGQLLEYEQYLAASRSSRKNSISLKSSPSVVEPTKTASSASGRPSFLLPQSNLYPTLPEKSPDLSPKSCGDEQNVAAKKSLFQLFDSDSPECSSSAFKAYSDSDSKIFPQNPIKSIVEVTQCLSMDQWMGNHQKVQTEILCRSPDSSDFANRKPSAPGCRSTLGLGPLGALPGPFAPQQPPPKMTFKLYDAPELPSPSTELSKLNFDSKQSPSSPKQPLKMDSFSTLPGTSVKCKKSENLHMATSKVNPLFSTTTADQPVPPERRRKRMMQQAPAPMDYLEDEPGCSGDWCPQSYSTPGRRAGGLETQIEKPEVVTYPFLDLKEVQNERGAFATNPMFGGTFSPSCWQPTPKPLLGPCSADHHRPSKHHLKIRSGGFALRKLIQGSQGRKLGPFDSMDRGRGFSGHPSRPAGAKHAKFSDLSKKFHDFLKNSRLHWSSLTSRGSMEPSTSLGCLNVGPPSGHSSPDSTSVAAAGPSKSQSICDMVSKKNNFPDKIRCVAKSTTVTTSSSSSSSVSNFLVSPTFVGPKMEPQSATGRRCSSASLSKRSEKSHDCGENMGSSTSLEIAVN